MKLATKFGNYGGTFVPETLMPALETLEDSFVKFSADLDCMEDLSQRLKHYAGRPTPLYYAENLSRKWGAEVYLKREDLLHGGAHKTNNAIGQTLLAKFMGKKTHHRRNRSWSTWSRLRHGGCDARNPC